jgi:hypothetical protein
MRTTVSLAFLAIAVSPALAQGPGGVQATLLHKGEDLYIHASPLNPGHLITLTVPSSGVMKPLLKAQPRPADSKKDAKGTASGASNRLPFQGDFVAGVAVDKDRLYVLTASRIFAQKPAGGSAPPATTAAKSELALIGHHLILHVFWLGDGSALTGRGYVLPLVSEDKGAKGPPDTKKVDETLGQGPLEVIEGGVKCRGTALLFSGKNVKSVEIKGRQFTPSPDFFDEGIRNL